MIDQVSIAKIYGTSPAEGTQKMRSTTTQATVAPAPGAEFGSVLSNLVTNSMDTVKAGEATAAAGVRGQASVQQVVEAVMAAEQTLQGSLAVRDKVVQSYLEISRMQI